MFDGMMDPAIVVRGGCVECGGNGNKGDVIGQCAQCEREYTEQERTDLLMSRSSLPMPCGHSGFMFVPGNSCPACGGTGTIEQTVSLRDLADWLTQRSLAGV